ncbi:MAG: FKBP-type peptidyl-prolyl cis-trans isomerase [Arcanobacterium sp.]|nr:FKBP-type peptidyl-prolyl cis-trans isomerase [Arcanobacterium sp.]
MLRKIGAIGLTAVLALGLSACSSNSNDTNDAQNAINVENLPAWDGRELKTKTEDGVVKIDFPQLAPPKDLLVQVIEEGTGDEITSTDFVIANYTGQVWGEDTPFDSSYTRKQPTGFSLEGVILGWTQGLTGQKVGTKLILSVPADLGYGPTGGQPNAGIGEDDVIAFYIEIVDAYGKSEAGSADATPEADLAALPVEIGGELGQPVTLLVKPDQPEPTESQTIVIARGKGEPVADGDSTVFIQYMMSYWDNSGSETTYGRTGPAAIKISQMPFFEGLKGLPIGSRVLITSPASKSGDEVTSPAYAVVLDILGQVK